MAEPVLLVLRPGDRPFDTAAFGKIDAAKERPRRQRRATIKARGEKVAEAPRKMKPRLGRNPPRTR